MTYNPMDADYGMADNLRVSPEKTAIRPSESAVMTVKNKMRTHGHDVPYQLIRSCLTNAYEVDKEVISNHVENNK